MPGKTATGKNRVVIVIPPTDHYRTYVIEGRIRKCTSRPLRLENSAKYQPCGPQCPVTRYQQLPSQSGIVQHYPEPGPQEPAQNETEQRDQPAELHTGTLENSRRDCNVPVKRPSCETLSSIEVKRGRSGVGDSDLIRKSLSTRPPSKKAPKPVHHENPKILDSYVIVEHLDLPKNCETVRLVQINGRLKQQLDNRLVVNTLNGRRLVTPLRKDDGAGGCGTSPSKLIVGQKFTQNPERKSRAENWVASKVFPSKPFAADLVPSELNKTPLSTNVIGTDASNSEFDPDSSRRSGKRGGAMEEDVGTPRWSKKTATPKASTVSKPTTPPLASSRASAIRKSLAIAMPKPKSKQRLPKKSVAANLKPQKVSASSRGVENETTSAARDLKKEHSTPGSENTD